jgi:lysophospholipase L1-like esterase
MGTPSRRLGFTNMADEALRPLLDALSETGSVVSSAGGGASLAPGALVGGVLIRALRDPAQRAAIVARTRYQEVPIPAWDLVVSTPVDAIRCLVNGAWLRMPVSYDEQVEGCNLLGLISPTTQIVDAIRAAAKPIDNFGLNVVPGGAYDAHLDLVKAYVVGVRHKGWKSANLGLLMSTLIMAQQFNANLDREIERRGYPRDAFVRPLGKAWVLDPRMLANGAANYGPLQGEFPGGTHNGQHYDYSQLFVDCIKVLARRISDGSTVDMRSFLATRIPTLSHQLAKYGPPSPTAGEPQAAAVPKGPSAPQAPSSTPRAPTVMPASISRSVAASPPVDVLLIGDSLAEGLAPRLTQLALQEGITFASSASKSTTIAHWLRGDQIVRVVEQFNPGLVLVCLGTNDLAAGGGAAAGRRAGELAATLLRSRVAVAWIAPPVMPFVDKGFRAALDTAVRSHGRFFDSTQIRIERAADRVHCTPAGYRTWAEAIAAWVPFSAFSVHPSAEPTKPPPAASSPHIVLRSRLFVAGMGEMSLDAYVARVVTGEMGGSPQLQALKAQAIAARTFVSRAMRDDASLGTPAKPVPNSEHFQVASKVAKPLPARAARETSGGVATHMGRLILANFVAGGAWPQRAWDGKGAKAKTEHYVTYNQGRSGTSVIKTSLASTGHRDNRGCMSQNGADELARRGWKWPAILRFFYGDDIQFTIPEPVVQAKPGPSAAPTLLAARPAGDSDLSVGLLALAAFRLLMKA